MSKVKSSQVFKQYNQQQCYLLPPSLEDLIEPMHLVRVINTLVEQMDLTGLITQYKGGGASAFHPRMLLKVLLYGYSVQLYTGRKIAKALRENIHFMWLGGMSRPDFRTINSFRSSKAKEAIEALFAQMLEFLMEHGYIVMENYFCDGSTFTADANKHKMVWKKNAMRYKEATAQKCKALFEQIDQLNEHEQALHGDNDLAQTGQSAVITRQDITEQVIRLNEKIKSTTDQRTRRKAASIKKKLEQAAGKTDRYDRQISTSGKRSGYNRTDEDASAMRMKNKVEVLPAYNVLAGCEDQFITGVSVHQNTNDGACFEEHMQQVLAQQPAAPDRVIADSGFGTEQNYALLESLGVDSYMKFPSFHREQKSAFRNDPFRKENFEYDPLSDSYQCPNNEQLVYQGTYRSENKRNGYQSTLKEYACSSCSGCRFYDQCCKPQNTANRRIAINEKLENYKGKAREKLSSEQGIRLRKQRGMEIESCFGDIKHNMGFRRFHLRGLKKVHTEITLVAMAHNMRKVYLKELRKAA